MKESTSSAATRILAAQGRELNEQLLQAGSAGVAADDSIRHAEALLAQEGIQPRRRVIAAPNRRPVPQLRSWEDIVSEADERGEVELPPLLSDAAAAAVSAQMQRWSKEFADLHLLQPSDYVVGAIAGCLAGFADAVFVGVPPQAGLLGGRRSEGGLLSKAVRDIMSKLLSKATVRRLERKFSVPFDIASNQYLDEPVDGLNPRSHRHLSPGHDVLLGWLIGTYDILTQACTFIDNVGKIRQISLNANSDDEAGVELFIRLLGALKQVAGHLLSDLPTAAGLPPPLFCLLQFIQSGSIKGPHGQTMTVAQAARVMYRKGYDFRHFLAGGICTALIEVIVRTAWVVREFAEGAELEQIVPIAKPRLNSTLFLAHSVAAGMNVGKFVASDNILSLSYPQWLAFSHYAAKQTLWLAGGRENRRKAYVRERLDRNWGEIDNELKELWSTLFEAPS